MELVLDFPVIAYAPQQLIGRQYPAADEITGFHFAFAVDYPERLHKMVLMGSGGAGPTLFGQQPSEGGKALAACYYDQSFETFRKLYPIDIYLELGAYAWGGTLNQPSGTITERMAKAKAEPKLFVNREIFNQFSAAREVEFEEKLAKLRASSR